MLNMYGQDKEYHIIHSILVRLLRLFFWLDWLLYEKKSQGDGYTSFNLLNSTLKWVVKSNGIFLLLIIDKCNNLKLLQYSFTNQGSDNASVDTDEYQSSPSFFLFMPVEIIIPIIKRNLEATAWYRLFETEIMPQKGWECRHSSNISAGNPR